MANRLDMAVGDVIFFGADSAKVVNDSLGHLRLKLAEMTGLIPDTHNLLWVTRFPLVEYDPEEKRYVAMHHPFTSPLPEDMDKLESDPAQVRARAYDLVMDGNEVGGGSIRIHRREIQEKMFKALGIGPEEAQNKFGFLLDAFRYGGPAPRRDRFRPGQAGHAPGRTGDHPRRDRLPQDPAGRVPHDQRPGRGGLETAPRAVPEAGSGKGRGIGSGKGSIKIPPHPNPLPQWGKGGIEEGFPQRGKNRL